MTNRELGRAFGTLAKLLEYHGENAFKIRGYTKAADLLRKSDLPIADYDEAALQRLGGVGKAIAAKIVELRTSGRLALLEEYRERTPPVARQLLSVRGIGPKKARGLVDGLGIATLDELVDAIRENRVLELKGWSVKSQRALGDQLDFLQRSAGQVRYSDALHLAEARLAAWSPGCERVAVTGAVRRQLPVVDRLAFVATPELGEVLAREGFAPAATDASPWTGSADGLPCHVYLADTEAFGSALVATTGSLAYLDEHATLRTAAAANHPSEAAVFAAANVPFAPAPQREAIRPAPPVPEADVLTAAHVRGVVHSHTTYSDGSAALTDIAKATREAGFEYLVVTDHSRSAGYAGGLSVEKLREQTAEVARLNEADRAGFRVFSGTESDILRDGALDYPDAVLHELDVVIASVHSTLRMSESDATARLLAAIANPYTTMLGHPTGRLLLSREGYPLDFARILDACAAHAVAIEINANPYRLDLDWTYVRRAADLGIPISINPDAHAIHGIDDIRYGVAVAQKAGLRPRECLNAKSADDFAAYLLARRRKRGIA